jgi:ATP-dependent RNA helicase SUPV3L1/SUV3
MHVDTVHKATGFKTLRFGGGDRYEMFGNLLLEQYEDVMRRFSFNYPTGVVTCHSLGIKDSSMLAQKAREFQDLILLAIDKAKKGDAGEKNNLLYYRFQRAFVDGTLRTLSAEIRTRFISYCIKFPLSGGQHANQKKLADLRYPVEWFPATREIQRTIHLHVGPTNSGKTYHALKRLEAAKTGVYAGPLRLLAHEVYTRMNAAGKPCALITGEERRVPENLKEYMCSCTVEMVPLNTDIDVAVIDEIQMMADPERGWAWTHALLGVRATEVHLCGELRTVNLIEDLCKLMGDKLVIHRYERLGPLKVELSSLRGDLTKLRKGDAVILFSRVEIHAMKKKIERVTGKRCAVVYGSLPPETRAQQAALFNDPDNDYDFLAASDAIGMGLNLSIRRVIFERSSKHDGISHRRINTSEIKQIAGRAGRFKSAQEAVSKGPLDITDGEPADMEPPLQVKAPNTGYVTTLDQFDHRIIEEAMSNEAAPLKKCGIFPPERTLERFASYFPPDTPFSYILLRLHDISSVNGSRFFLTNLKDQLLISDVIQSIKLTIRERIVFVCSPASFMDEGAMRVLQELAECVASQSNGNILDVKSLNLELLDAVKSRYKGGPAEYLKHVEALHKSLTLYLWLSYRFPGVFTSQALAFHIKSIVEEKIDECLDEVSEHYKPTKQRKVKALDRSSAAENIRASLEPTPDAEDGEPSLVESPGMGDIPDRSSEDILDSSPSM